MPTPADVLPTLVPSRSIPTGTLELEPLGPGFGAIVHGLDLAAADESEIAAVRRALTEHKVLFFGGHTLDRDSQVALGNGRSRCPRGAGTPAGPISNSPTSRCRRRSSGWPMS